VGILIITQKVIYEIFNTYSFIHIFKTDHKVVDILRNQLCFFVLMSTFVFVCIYSNLLHTNLRLLIYAYSFAFLKMSHNLQLHIVTNRENILNLYNIMIPSLIFAMNFLFKNSPINEVYILYALLTVNAYSKYMLCHLYLGYFVTMTAVVQELARKLGIYVFTIKRNK